MRSAVVVVLPNVSKYIHESIIILQNLVTQNGKARVLGSDYEASTRPRIRLYKTSTRIGPNAILCDDLLRNAPTIHTSV